MKLSLGAISDLASACAYFDPKEVTTGEGEKKTTVKQSYDLDPKAYYALAKNKKACKAALEAISDERYALIMKNSKGSGTLQPGSVELGDFMHEIDIKLREEIDFSAHLFPISSLKVEVNHVPITVLEALLPILEGEL